MSGVVWGEFTMLGTTQAALMRLNYYARNLRVVTLSELKRGWRRLQERL